MHYNLNLPNMALWLCISCRQKHSGSTYTTNRPICGWDTNRQGGYSSSFSRFQSRRTEQNLSRSSPRNFFSRVKLRNLETSNDDDGGSTDVGPGEGRPGAGRHPNLRPLAEVLFQGSRRPHHSQAQVRLSQNPNPNFNRWFNLWNKWSRIDVYWGVFFGLAEGRARKP